MENCSMDTLSSVNGRSVLIGIPLREDESRFAHVDARFMASVLGNITTLANAGIPVNVHQAVSPGLGLDQARNTTVKLLLETKATHLFFWDADTLLLPDAILKLLQRNLPVVSGLYMQRGMSHRPVVLDMKVEGKQVGHIKYLYSDISEVPDNELVEVGLTPGGIFLVERSVFEKINPPWFAFPKAAVGEDVYFSCLLQTAGYKQYVDTGVEGIHLVQHPAASQQALEAWGKAYGYEITRPS
jgi:GT2 family glycosyltransferase